MSFESSRFALLLVTFIAASAAACSTAPGSAADAGPDRATDSDAADGAASSCNGKATQCPYSGPGMSPPGHSAPILDPAACGLSPFGSDAGPTTCQAFCEQQNPATGLPQRPNVTCVASDAAPGGFTCECFLIP